MWIGIQRILRYFNLSWPEVIQKKQSRSKTDDVIARRIAALYLYDKCGYDFKALRIIFEIGGVESLYFAGRTTLNQSFRLRVFYEDLAIIPSITDEDYARDLCELRYRNDRTRPLV